MILGSRSSKLAMVQTGMVADALRRAAPTMEVRIVPIRSMGDEVRNLPLRAFDGLGAFTKELDRRVLSGEVDAVVHSLKDMPLAVTPGTVIAAILPRGPPEDVLVSPVPLESLGPGAVVGTSSARRAATIRRLRPDLRTKDIRGNVPTRIRKMRDGEYDAIVLARAGLERLGISANRYILDPDVFVPVAGQGAIAVVCRVGSPHLDLLATLDDPATRVEVEAERRVLRLLGGACHLPIGVMAKSEGDKLRIRASLSTANGIINEEGTIVVGRSAAELDLDRFAIRLRKQFEAKVESRNGQGDVFLVGAGPGDARLITVRGLELLRTADVVVHDSLVSVELLREVRAEAEVFDVGKRGGHHKVEQEEISHLLVKKALEGKRVVRLKGGDPFLFGRGGEEAEVLRRNGVPVHVVPGVTSAISAPALAGIPVTHRNVASHVTMVTGHEGAGKSGDAVDWAALARIGTAGGTLVLLMGVSELGANAQRLIEAGMDPKTPAAVVEKGAMPDQRTVTGTLDGIAEACAAIKLAPPAVVVIGNVVRLREGLGDLV